MTTGAAPALESHLVNSRMSAALIDSLRAIVWEADPETFQFRFVSSHAEELLGFPREDWVSDPRFWLNHTHPDDIARAASFCKECTSRGVDHDFEYRMVARDGRVVWLHDIVTVERTGSEAVALRGIMIDITERREIEAALQSSQARLAQAQKAGGVGTFDWDMRTDEAIWSPELIALFGNPQIDSPREAWLNRVHADDLMAAIEATHEARDSGTLDIEYRVRWPDGSIRWQRARGEATRDAEGKPVRMLGAIADVTSRKLLEQELHQAQKMDALGRLAGGIAHDFNNLLTVIATNALVLSRERRSAEEAEDLHDIRRAAARGAQLIRQLLAFSRKQVEQPELVRLDEEVADITAMLERVLGAEIRLSMQLRCGDATVLIAPGHIQQIVMNLAVNARDAMPAGGRLAITTSARRAWLTLRVSDTGQGMSDAVKAHLFEPFFTTKEPGKGTGLGLSTVFGQVRQAGGTIIVDSREGQGTAVEVGFPRADQV